MARFSEVSNAFQRPASPLEQGPLVAASKAEPADPGAPNRSNRPTVQASGGNAMRISGLSRHALSSCVAAAMLAGCGGHASNGAVPINGNPDSAPSQRTFHYTGGEQHFTVPLRVTHITVVARGAKGAGYRGPDGGSIIGTFGVPLGYYSGDTYGGRVRVVIPVTPREKLIVYVGGDAIDAIGGYNGGGSGDPDSFHSFGGLGGGGASDVREGGDTLSDRIVVAAGGGGFGNAAAQTYCPTPVGGKGGNLTGATGIGGREGFDECGGGATGGTQSVGGSGGAGGTECRGYDGEAGGNGAFGVGGSGGAGSSSGGSYVAAGGGGGGGGYYGGGGGGGSCDIESASGDAGGGGGGGSSYVEPNATDVRMWRGWKNPASNGLVVFSW
jgi:hypothetical protein